MLDDAVNAEGGGEPAGLRVGIMVEVPATALKAAAFAPHVDFFSIGTNDLTQYALAAERGNDAVAALADPFDPGVLALVAADRPHGDAGRGLRRAGRRRARHRSADRAGRAGAQRLPRRRPRRQAGRARGGHLRGGGSRRPRADR